MIRVGITGVPGSGKTTLARSLASRCRSEDKIKNVELINEYARRYISKHGLITSILEQYRILEKQCEWEDSVCNDSLDLMITDSPVFLGFLYCTELSKSNSKEIMFFNDIFKKMVKLNFPEPRYDIIFHLPPFFKPVEDGVRAEEHFEDHWREKSDSMIMSIFQIFKPRVFVVEKAENLEDRTNKCLKFIKDYLQMKQRVIV